MREKKNSERISPWNQQQQVKVKRLMFLDQIKIAAPIMIPGEKYSARRSSRDKNFFQTEYADLQEISGPVKRAQKITLNGNQSLFKDNQQNQRVRPMTAQGQAIVKRSLSSQPKQSKIIQELNSERSCFSQQRLQKMDNKFDKLTSKVNAQFQDFRIRLSRENSTIQESYRSSKDLVISTNKSSQGIKGSIENIQEKRLRKLDELLGQNYQKQLDFAEFLKLLSVAPSKISPDKEFEDLNQHLQSISFQETYLLDQRLIITHKIVLENGLFIKQKLNQPVKALSLIKKLVDNYRKRVSITEDQNQFIIKSQLYKRGNKYPVGYNKDKELAIYQKSKIQRVLIQRFEEIKNYFMFNETKGFSIHEATDYAALDGQNKQKLLIYQYRNNDKDQIVEQVKVSNSIFDLNFFNEQGKNIINQYYDRNIH
ncbi:UNKNOWN [Stylonychia lemnae]|uniref:Uncharacterized protein n=1 Tax=Stylonychia lemnae TaxID=5949 RepID=A0A078A3U1_STYLE|nr:UNKNOWN [Stylonychia lemnae]|eukprot:CDW76923.1 UNKNOWN [Stylonychia lemnae]